MKLRTLITSALALAPLALAACSDSTGTQAPGTVQVRFGVTGSPANLRANALAAEAAGGPLVVTGTNGTLSITAIQVVVSRLKLNGVHDQPCVGQTTGDDSQGGGDDADECEFQAGPFFVDLPLDGGQLTVATGTVPPGTYDRLRFRVKNLDFRDDDSDDEDDDAASQAAVAALFNQIRAQFPDWPARASMRVAGTFTPTGGPARPFTAYLKAEVKVELPLSPALTVAEGSSTSQVAVTLDPAAFFKSGSAVVDLSQFNGSVGDFEFEAEHGFRGEGHHGGDD
jgi:hypothetical protein